jgi:hypothetical protein
VTQNETDIINQFIEDFSRFKFDTTYFYSTYGGKEQVQEWLSRESIIKAIHKRSAEIKAEKAKNQELYVEEWSRLRNKALENVVKILNDDNHRDHCKVSMWILDGEHSFITARAEMLAEKAVESSGKQDRPPIRIIRDNGSKSSDSSA